MQMPNVSHKLYDPKRKIKIIVWAYRKLDDYEVKKHATYFARTNKLKNGCRYDVITTID